MTNKDEANPRQRITMEQRWAKAREKCAAQVCDPEYALHVKGCARRLQHDKQAVLLSMPQKVKVTNLNTGVASEATIVYSDTRAVKDVLEQHDKQAVHLEPMAEAMDVPQEALDAAEPGSGHYSYALPNNGGVLHIPKEITFPGNEYWDAFERGEPQARNNRGFGSPDVSISFADSRRVEESPARPWWKFWGRRG